MSHYSPSQKHRIFKNKNLLIFDFDGVLADSFNTFYPLIRGGMNSIGLSLTPDQYRNFFIGNVHQGFMDFIKDEDKHARFLEFRNSNYDKYYNDEENKAKLFPESIKFLKRLGSNNCILTIASSGRQKNVESLLEASGVKDLFALIIANSNSKTAMLSEIMSKFHATSDETIMITDTVGDILMAKESGLKTIAVTWGFHSIGLLKTVRPDYIAKNFQALHKILQ